MKNWKNAIKKSALAVLIAVMVATTIICSAGAMNHASNSSEWIFMGAGIVNLIIGFGATYAVIQKAQKMDVINNAKKIG